ncbi:twin-arginine translocase subunit TatC [Staphylococcus auricularis]|uniref:twin-arginine translocase subunit TatC n=1 Tax=Staphylococcus auricularis TaxID=29379 RepID=UPI001BD144B2|nr:twin-arginine translocase subunit TatC [Staphylococcus auricularis]MCG7340718.1 twin-arginine translocase subunit TatC [Staphylococcus auricularis]
MLNHFCELRSRLIKIGVAFVIALLAVYISSHWWMDTFIHAITQHDIDLHAFSFTEMIQIYLMIILFCTLCVVSPVLFYQLWAFIEPGLKAVERQFVYKYSFLSVLLFLTGIVLAYVVIFPLIIRFSLNLSQLMSIQPVIGFKQYLTELLRWLLFFGIIFQLPILFIGLTKLDLIDAQMLKPYRKYVYFICFVVASLIAPPDLFLNILLSLPLILLFELSMFVIRFTKPNT